MDIFKNIDWRKLSSIYGAQTVVPALPGVYAFGVVREELGLLLDIMWVYVGSSSNLRRRIAQHIPLVESNPGLRAFVSRERQAQIWYTTTDAQSSRKLEVQLIRKLGPKFNRIQYRFNKEEMP